MKGFDRISMLFVCLTLATVPANADAPRLQASHGAGGISSKTATASGCSDVSWLDPQKPPRFLADVNQAAGSGSCQFHEFAAQNFFALALGASPAIRTWPTALQVFPDEGATVCGSAAALGAGVRPFLKKNPPPTVGDIPQASGQPLVDQNGRYVQYEIRVNPRFCEVVSRCQLYNKKCVTAAAAVKPVFRFPAGDAQTPGVAEVKLSWRVMETCNLPDSPPASTCKKDNLADFLTIKGISIEPYSPKNAGAVSVTLGLVGFHLIQKTATHPEYVWSTWEHVSNAPVCAGSDNSVCQDPSAASASIGTASGWSLASPPAPQPCDPAKDKGCANAAYYTTPAQGVVDPSQPPTQVCRFLPCGGGDQTEIASLNKAIRAKLAGNLWSRYFLVGTLWGKNPPSPEPLDGNPQEEPAGSLVLANTTMETYVQDTKNCFFCHRNGPAGTNIDFTHSLVRATQAADACPVDLNTCASSTPQPIRSSRP